MALNTKLAGYSLELFLACAPVFAETHGYDGFSEHSRPEVPVTVHGDTFAFPAIDTNLSPYRIGITPGDDHWADVTFQNRLASGIYVPDTLIFTFEDRVVTVTVEHQAGDAPETIVVTPPPGFYAIPDRLVVPEDTEVVIEIHVQALS